MFDREQIYRSYRDLDLENANEAETRLKLIDHILFDILKWTHDDVQIEERISDDGTNKFADYVVRTANTALVIEAKRVGVIFSELSSRRRENLRGRIVSGLTGASIRQARDYAVALGIPFAAVTNGAQWIVFPAHRVDQVKFSDSSCIIFNSIDSTLQNDFSEFYSLLSRQSVISGSLEDQLLGRQENQFLDHRINSFYPNSFGKPRHDNLFRLIEGEIITAFTEDTVLNNDQLLEACYVQTPERVRFDERIQMYISRADFPTKSPAKRPLKKKDRSALSDIIENAKSRTRPLAILILGTVGCGKTTFLHYTRRISAHKHFVHSPKNMSDAYWFYLDFRDFNAGDDPIRFVVQRLRSLIEEDDFLSDYDHCLKIAYKDQIAALLRGPLSLLGKNEEEQNKKIVELLMEDHQRFYPYIEKILSYVSSKRPIFLVIDNVDQFEHATTQSEIFSQCMAFSRSLSLNLVLCMREATYVQHRSSPLFDAFDFDPLKIDPPVLSSVLSKRLDLARNLLKEKQAKFETENGARFTISDLSQVIEMVQPSILGTEVGHLIDVLASSDIRLALRMTREFLQYGYTATGRALEIYQRTGRYVLPTHEALRAIMLGNQTVYSDEHSVILNPLDAKLSRDQAQFLRLYVLSALVHSASDQRSSGLSGEDIRDALRELGFSDDIALRILIDLCRGRVAFNRSHGAPTLTSTFHASRLGGYIVRVLLADFTFLENILGDTFISDENHWSAIKTLTDKIYSERNIIVKLRIRKERVESFREFCANAYSVLRNEGSRRGLSALWCGHPLNESKIAFEQNITRVLGSAIRNYGEDGHGSAGN